MDLLKSLIPLKVRPRVIRFADYFLGYYEFIADARRYRRLSGVRDSAVDCSIRGDNLEAQITKDYHRIEKGLALESPRRPFGASVRNRLESLLPLVDDGDRVVPYVSYASDALSALDDWNNDGTLTGLASPERVVRNPIFDSKVLGEYFESRRSVRNFSSVRVPSKSLIDQAIKIASNTPSVCNRQSGRLHLYSGRKLLEVINYQNGNAGFGENVPRLAVVTVKSGLFLGVSERNQRWIDGGLFAMTFVWALHGLGIASCMLNWSRNNSDSVRLRRAAGIPNDEDIVVMIAFGFPEDSHRVARSMRRPSESIVNWH